jgi:hypothetical protein
VKDLSRESRALLAEVRQVEHLNATDKARIRGKLTHRIGAGLALGTALTASATVAEAAHAGALATVVAWLPAAAKVVSAVALTGAVGVGVVKVAHLGSPSAATSVPAVVGGVPSATPRAHGGLLPAPAAAAAVPADVGIPPSEQTTQPALRQQLSTTKRLSVALPVASAAPVQGNEVPPATGDHLVNQVAAIRVARAAIRQGDAHAALAALDREFPEGQAGALAPEAALARVAAYCRLGQVQVARHTVDLFSLQFPDSPLVARMRNSCAAEVGPTQ